MLNRRAAYILKLITKECVDGKFHILDTGEINDYLPDKLKCDEVTIKDEIDTLVAKKLVSVKYADLHEYCIMPSKLGEQVSQSAPIAVATGKSTKVLIGATILGFFAGILGAVVVVYLFPMIFG